MLQRMMQIKYIFYKYNKYKDSPLMLPGSKTEMTMIFSVQGPAIEFIMIETYRLPQCVCMKALHLCTLLS